MDREKLISEVILGLPSKRIMENTNNLAVVNPKNNNLVILKNRDDKNLTIEDFEYYGEKRHGWDHQYNELLRKSILIDHTLLNKRGREALYQL